MFSLKYLLPLLSLLLSQTTLASEPVSELLNNSIYFLELLVIAIVAIALIVLTLSIAKSRRKISDMVTDIRSEMSQERTVFAMTVKSIKEKEEQISYMAHLLQSHLESDAGNDNSGKKKAISNEVIVEILDDITDHQVADKGFAQKKSSTAINQTKDSRIVAADGSIKQAHFGPDQYLAELDSYQHEAHQRVQDSIKHADQYISNMLNDIRSEVDLVKKERAKLNDFIAAIKSNIRPKDSRKMNSKDSNIIRKLSDIDGRLEVLQRSHLEISKRYSESMAQVKKYAVSLSEDTIEVEEAVAL